MSRICRQEHGNMEDRVVINSKEVMSQATTLRYEWNAIPWPKLERKAFKLQKQIYQASQRGNSQLVRKLQRLLLNSTYAKLLSTRKVTQDNRGKKTAGVDGKLALTPKERIELASTLRLDTKAMLIRRIWIPKPGKEEKRPLGIPTISERARQALVKMALEPEWEAKFEPNSYGFRPGRSCHDAKEAIFESIKRKQAYVLDADIAGCFDNIDHVVLLSKLQTNPLLRRTIKAWLKAGILDKAIFHSNEKGTPQGGIISPLLANIALHGMEMDTKQALRQELFDYMKKTRGKASYMMASRKLSVIRYADDFVVIHEDRNILLKAKTYISEWLKRIGLELKPEKTRLCHTYNSCEGTKAGFNFLGFNFRQYKSNTNTLGYSTIIKPSKESLNKHLFTIKLKLREHRGESQETLIRNLNPIIKGWCNYYKVSAARKIFEKASHHTFEKLWRWIRFRHPNKGRRWVKGKYFLKHKGNNWRFKTNKGHILVMHYDFKIKRFIKVKGVASPYNGNFIYWATHMGRHPMLTPRIATLLKKQRGKCGHCKLFLNMEDIIEVHHVDQNNKNNNSQNLLLVHGHCHDKVHGKCMYEKHQITEEPDVLKGTSPVLEPSMDSDVHA